MSPLEDIAKAFGSVVEIVAKHPAEAIAVALTVTGFYAGYGKGYHDGRKDQDEKQLIPRNA